MAEDPPDYHRPGAIARAVAIHGSDTEEEYSAHTLVVLFQMAIASTPLLAALGAAVGAALTSNWLFWVFSALTIALAWPALIGSAGALRLVAGMGTVVLTYKDRIVVQRRYSTEEVFWDDIGAVYLRTQSGDEKTLVSYEMGFFSKLWIVTSVPLAKFWTEWTEVRTKDGRVVRLPSTISDYDNLSRAVQTEVSFRVWPGITADRRAGLPVNFGPLTLEADGLRIGDQWVPWTAHHATWLEHGQVVTTEKPGTPFGPTVRTEEVPNLAVAVFIINEVDEGADDSDFDDET